MCYHWTFLMEYEKVGLWLFIIHSLMASGLKKMYHESILLFHRIKVIHACFYRILSRFQLYSPHSLSLTKFPSPPGSRDLPLGRLGPTLGDRGGARLLPQLPGEVSPAPALPSVVWVSAPCGAGDARDKRGVRAARRSGCARGRVRRSSGATQRPPRAGPFPGNAGDSREGCGSAAEPGAELQGPGVTAP